jgi:hypothetical protein
MTGLAFFSQISLTTHFGLSETRKRKPVANDDFTLKQTTFFFFSSSSKTAKQNFHTRSIMLFYLCPKKEPFTNESQTVGS